MKEYRTNSYYHPGVMMASCINVKDPCHPLIGKLTNERCPQCGAKLFQNGVRDEWCWNCDFEK